MVIIQIAQKIKILFHCSIKKLFKLSFNKLSIVISFLLFSCSSHLIQAEEIKPENLKCDVAYNKILTNKNFMTSKNKNFKEIFFSLNLENDINVENFNLIIVSDYKPTPGYDLKIDKIIKKGDKLTIFTKEELKKNSSILNVITYPFCLIKIKNLDEYKVFIN